MREVSFMWGQLQKSSLADVTIIPGTWSRFMGTDFISVCVWFFSASEWTEMFDPNPSWHRRLSAPCDIFAYSGKQKHSMNIIKEPLRILEYCRLHIAFFQRLPCSLSSSLHLFYNLSSSLLSPSISFQHHSLFLCNKLNPMCWLSSFMSPVASFFEVHRHTNAWMCKYRHSQTNTDMKSCSTK